MSVSPPSPMTDDRSRYPVHEEENVPETPLHEEAVRYLRNALAPHFAGGYVTGNVCVYWEPGNFQRYVAPDVMVLLGSLADPEARVTLVWEDPEIRFVAEISSRSTRRIDERVNLPIYEQVLGIEEYLFADVETGELRLRRLKGEAYEEVAPERNGRLWSEELQVEIEMDDRGFVWLYTRDGARLLTYTEENRRRIAAESLLQFAEARAAEEVRQRQEAEERAAAEARQRQMAETQAREAEARATQEAARRAEVERELAALREQLRDRDA